MLLEALLPSPGLPGHGAGPHDVVVARPPPPVQHAAAPLINDLEALALVEVDVLAELADDAPVLQPGVAPLTSLGRRAKHALSFGPGMGRV